MSDHLPGISILMTAYNPGKYLVPAVESILNQTFTDFEFVIVNDGSTDETEEYLDGLDDPRLKIFHEPNRGTAGGTNFGLQHCTRKYVARMDADDISALDRLAKQYEFMESNPDVVLLGSYAEVIGSGKTGLSIPLPTEHDEIYAALLGLNHGISHGSCMFRNEVIQKMDGYWKVHRTYDDWDMFLRMADHGKLANLPEVLYQYRTLSTSLVGSRLGEMRKYYWYAIDCAKRRNSDTPILTLEEFFAELDNRSWASKKLEAMSIYALDQYRVATAEICAGKKTKGYFRLGWAALCSPKRTLNRLGRILSRGSKQTANTAST